MLTIAEQLAEALAYFTGYAPVTFPPGAGRRGGIGRTPDVPAIGDKSRMSQIALGHGHIRYGRRTATN